MADLEELQPSLRDSVQDDVRAAFEQHSSDVAEALTKDETATEKADRLRDEHGKFVARDKVEPSAPEITTDADQPAEQVVQQSRAVEPPRGWSADEKAQWATLPPAIQAAVSRRENEFNDGGRQWSEQRKGYEQALAPVHELSSQYQMPPDEVVARLVSVEKRLGDPNQAPQVIAELAQAYGVNLQTLTSQPPVVNQAPVIDPNRITQDVTDRVRKELAAEEGQRQALSLIDKFGTERDAGGAPKYPHFNNPDVRSRMGSFIANGWASSMEDAYNQVVYSIPAVREALAPPSVSKAKSAAVSLKGSPGGQKPISRPESKGSVVDDVRAAWSAVNG